MSQRTPEPADEEPGVAYELWLILKREQRRYGWTTLKLAEVIGKDPSIIYRMPKQMRPPPRQTVKDIADALKLDEDELMRAAGHEVEIPHVAGQTDVAQAIRASDALNPSEKETLLGMLSIIMSRKSGAGRNGGVAI